MSGNILPFQFFRNLLRCHQGTNCNNLTCIKTKLPLEKCYFPLVIYQLFFLFICSVDTLNMYINLQLKYLDMSILLQFILRLYLEYFLLFLMLPQNYFREYLVQHSILSDRKLIYIFQDQIILQLEHWCLCITQLLEQHRTFKYIFPYKN